MKKLIYLFLLIPFLSSSQIVVTDSNLPDIGDTVITARYFGNYSIGTSGTNQNWNFSNVSGMPEMLLGFIDPLITPYQASFPNSNICAEIDSGIYYYLNKSINGLTAIGYVDQGMIYPFSKMLLPTPLNYLDTITNTQILFQWDTLLTPPVPSIMAGISGPYVIDSIKVTYSSVEQYIVDAWGQMQMPNTTYDVLRIFESNYDAERTFFKLIDTTNAQTQWVQDPSGPNITWDASRFSWRTNDSLIHWSLAEVETDSAGNPFGDLVYYLGNSINNIIISPPIVNLVKLVDVSCYGNTDGLIMLDIVGTAFPFTFFWTGPNGFTSTSQDIFNLMAGSYSVTVTDANGNNIIQNFSIAEPPLLVASISQLGIDITVNASGGIAPYSYLWNTGDTLSTITPLVNGMYTCDVIDKAGCITNTSFNVTNIPSSIFEVNSTNRLIKTVDVLGREDKEYLKGFLFYIYEDGTVEKRMVIE